MDLGSMTSPSTAAATAGVDGSASTTGMKRTRPGFVRSPEDGPSSWPRRLRAREPINYREAEECEGEGIQSSDKHESCFAGRLPDHAHSSTSLLGHSLQPPPVVRTRSIPFSVTINDSERSRNEANPKRAGEGDKRSSSLVDGADTIIDVRGASRRSNNRRDNVQVPRRTEHCSGASGVDIHQILRVLHHLESNTKTPFKRLSRHRFSRPVAVPPCSAKIEAEKEIETGGGGRHGKEESDTCGSEGQRTEMVASLDSSGSFGVQTNSPAISMSMSWPCACSSSPKMLPQGQPESRAP